ncbi:hypothetical protein VspSTUT11_42910 [Vibrio sp. STUT-A11]|nr:hypothetical protein VspSTUT11_42910 [Vibrio sp. STUT-A11]
MHKFYFVNNLMDDNGDHEVHTLDCNHLPNTERTLVGWFDNCEDAVKAAKKFYLNSNGCYWCSRSCHTS